MLPLSAGPAAGQGCRPPHLDPLYLRSPRGPRRSAGAPRRRRAVGERGVLRRSPAAFAPPPTRSRPAACLAPPVGRDRSPGAVLCAQTPCGHFKPRRGFEPTGGLGCSHYQPQHQGDNASESFSGSGPRPTAPVVPRCSATAATWSAFRAFRGLRKPAPHGHPSAVHRERGPGWGTWHRHSTAQADLRCHAWRHAWPCPTQVTCEPRSPLQFRMGVATNRQRFRRLWRRQWQRYRLRLGFKEARGGGGCS